MKIALFAACAAATIVLAGCSGNAAAVNLLGQIVTDKNCGHDDKVAVVAGAFGTPGSLTASAERHCPIPGTVAAPASTPPASTSTTTPGATPG